MARPREVAALECGPCLSDDGLLGSGRNISVAALLNPEQSKGVGVAGNKALDLASSLTFHPVLYIQISTDFILSLVLFYHG